MGGWGEMAGAFALFLASHALPARPAARGRLVAAFGERGYLAGYSALSLVLLAWLVVAAGRAPYVPLWDYAPWQAWAALAGMLAACLLVGFALGAPNPLSFAGAGEGFVPDRPGVAGLARHPLLAALALWAAVHAMANGNLAHVLLFGGFAAFAVLGMRLIDRRRRRQLGEAEWRRLAACTSSVPLAALAAGRWRPGAPDAGRLVLSVTLWVGLLWLHPPLIGVSPLPPP